MEADIESLKGWERDADGTRLDSIRSNPALAWTDLAILSMSMSIIPRSIQAPLPLARVCTSTVVHVLFYTHSGKSRRTQEQRKALVQTVSPRVCFVFKLPAACQCATGVDCIDALLLRTPA